MHLSIIYYAGSLLYDFRFRCRRHQHSVAINCQCTQQYSSKGHVPSRTICPENVKNSQQEQVTFADGSHLLGEGSTAHNHGLDRFREITRIVARVAEFLKQQYAVRCTSIHNAVLQQYRCRCTERRILDCFSLSRLINSGNPFPYPPKSTHVQHEHIHVEVKLAAEFA